MKELNPKKTGLIVISKSGTTTEPAVAFRILKTWMEKAVGKKKAKARIAAVTDKSQGALKGMADAEGFKTFVIPDDIGGRYSVLTPVGLLPIAVAGFESPNSSRARKPRPRTASPSTSPKTSRPATRRPGSSSPKGQDHGSLVQLQARAPLRERVVETALRRVGRKRRKGTFSRQRGPDHGPSFHGPVPAGRQTQFAGDHDLGQKRGIGYFVPKDKDDREGLNFLAGKKLSWVNEQAMKGTAVAHRDGGLPVIRLTMDEV